MTRRRYRKAVAALALGAWLALWALPAAAAQPTPAPAAAQPAPTAAPAKAAQQAAAPAAESRGGLGALNTTTGGAALVGVGAYSFLRKQRQDERDRRRAEPQEPVYFENHTRNGTLRPEERDRLE